ncbi:MAG: endopeptidase La [Desulfobulbaceae bacterium]|nr:endopeptidase La [Desulfobulbaceae bacterium]MDY0351675.1 endopeptidase La [Desulfobulbaceae bacterium]
MSGSSRTYILPILPLKSAVVFPYVTMPISIQRPASIAAVDASLSAENKLMAVFTQYNPLVDEPKIKDLYPIGTSVIIKLIARSNSMIQLVIQAQERVEIAEPEPHSSYLKARVRTLPLIIEDGIDAEALQREIMELAGRYFDLGHPEVKLNFPQFAAPGENFMQLVYALGQLLNLDVVKGQMLLEAPTEIAAMRIIRRHLIHEIQILEVRKKIADEAQIVMGKEQRDYILRQQKQAIQRELGEQSSAEEELAELQKKIEEAQLPEEISREVKRELSRLEQIPPISPEYQVARSHLDLVLELPWHNSTTDNLNLDNARQVLDEDHYGLKEIKERIVEQLAVMKLNPEARAPILCFAGPPGVGKTSLGQSIARALGRKFERFSLGGMHDEAELRGHRRTYIGAMPGRIIQALRRSGVQNPLLMLDEIDKLGRDYRGDPSAALMEILDPEQNRAFRDNYLDLPFDLSKVFFITTANTIDTVPKPLLDRMELIRLSGYSDEEKLEIALRYLLPRQRKQAGLSDEQFQLPRETIEAVIRRYTREAGVRELERMLGRLARKAAILFAEDHQESVTVRLENLPDMLGPERFFIEKLRHELPAGVAIGLAWTEAGGDVLYIEAIALPEGALFTLTGHLGEVMKESAMAANSYVLSHCETLGIKRPQGTVHIHVPAGAIPKDGPSAGVTMAAALASLYSGLPCRADTAMTGEITLSGLVLPVGGIKEKVLAARRASIHRVVLPGENEKELRELPDYVLKEMECIFVERIVDVLREVIPALFRSEG